LKRSGWKWRPRSTSWATRQITRSADERRAGA
jgi:hypothetical protein